MTDEELKVQGVRALIEALGDVQAERFVSLLTRAPFDYTKWQRGGDVRSRAVTRGYIADVLPAAHGAAFSPHPLDSRLCYSLRTGEGLTFPVTSEAGPPEACPLQRPLTRR